MLERTGVLRRAAATCIVLLASSGCVSLPDGDQLIASAGPGIVRIDDAGCATRGMAVVQEVPRGVAIDPAGFGMLNWNLYKAREQGWQDDLARLGRGQDLLLLQEAHLTPPFRAALDRSAYHWSMVRAFDLQGAETGVLTAAEIPPSGVCLSRTAEPLIRLPKSALLTRYPLEGLSEDLWVANVHGVNFTLGTSHYRAQLESLASAVEQHGGPLILAGDFNNWSKRRSDLLFEITERMGLVPVTLSDDARSRHWGYPVDFVFYRGVEVTEAGSVDVSSSDHNPILVRFRMPGYSGGGNRR